MVRAEMRVYVTGPRREEVLTTLRWFMRQMEAEPGLQAVDLQRSLERKDQLVFVQSWRTQESLEQFVRSDDFVRYLEILDLSERPPEIYFDSVSERRGLEFVQAVRREASMKRQVGQEARRRR